MGDEPERDCDVGILPDHPCRAGNNDPAQGLHSTERACGSAWWSEDLLLLIYMCYKLVCAYTHLYTYSCSMCIYTYTDTYIYIYIYTHTHIYIYMYTCICIYTCIHTYIHMQIGQQVFRSAVPTPIV